jgi:hypothetical protein
LYTPCMLWGAFTLLMLSRYLPIKKKKNCLDDLSTFEYIESMMMF